jgi:hypothetical protein
VGEKNREREKGRSHIKYRAQDNKSNFEKQGDMRCMMQDDAQNFQN